MVSSRRRCFGLYVALRCAFPHLRFRMFAARTIENEYLRNFSDVRDGANKLHWVPTMEGGADRS